MTENEMHEFAHRAAELLRHRIRRLRAKASGRASTIRRLAREREATRRWLRGEIAGGPPIQHPFLCLYCRAPIEGDHQAAIEHVCRCPDNPLVQRIAKLEHQLAEAQR